VGLFLFQLDVELFLLAFVDVRVVIGGETDGGLADITGKYDVIAVIFIFEEEVEIVSF
jgi:hypothetical protein